MANRREYRRRVYFEQLFAGHPEWGSFDEEDDQVLYQKDRVVTHAAGDDDPIIRELKNRHGCVVRQADDDIEDQDPAGSRLARVRFLDVPPDAGLAATDLVRNSFGTAPVGEALAPEYVFLTQQKVHPGDDPEPIARPHRVNMDPRGPGAGVTVAVIDTGLAQNLVEPIRQDRQPPTDVDELWGAPKPTTRDLDLDDPPFYLGPAAGHGTFISDLITQIAPGANVVNVKVAGPDGACTERDIVNGIRRLLLLNEESRPHIVNLSVGMYGLWIRGRGSTRRFVPPLGLQAAIDDLVAANIAVVAAAGNSDSTDPMYPAAFRKVIGVAALDSEHRRCSFSNFGDWVEASARGLRLRGQYVKGEEDPVYETDMRADTFESWAEWSGTSFAAPLVSAKIAIELANDMTLTPRQAAQRVLDEAELAHDWGCGKHIEVDVPSMRVGEPV